MTLDIKDLYVNILVNEVLHITKTLSNYNNINNELSQEMNSLLEAVLNLNYLQHLNKFYKPNKRIAMGSPISGAIANIFIQYYENLILKHTLETKAIIYYNRYVDDILIIFNSTIISEEQITR
jgi:hypothetical protein